MPFRVGLTADFATDAAGHYEAVLAQSFDGVDGLIFETMPAAPGNVATPELLNPYDALLSLGLRITPESLRGVQQLAVVARWGVGYDMIDVDALTAADIALAITPGAVRRPVAEAIIGLIFALSTNLVTQDHIVRAGGWRRELPGLGRNIKGRTLGSLGCGNIAQELFTMARGLGFGRLLAYDPVVPPDAIRSFGVEPASFDEVLQRSDYVTINVPLSAATRGLVGERELRLMQPTAFLINTSRGPIVQEEVLVRALQERWIAGAGLDVFEVEPLPAGSPLRTFDNVILAPHSLAWTAELARDNTAEACRNILSICRGEVPGPVVNRDVLQRPGFQAKLRRYGAIA